MKKKALKKMKNLFYSELDRAYSKGYKDGYDEADDNYMDSFFSGVENERARIRAIFDMNIQWALESNKGSEVVFFTKAKQIIEPVEVDYSEEAYQKDLEDEGF